MKYTPALSRHFFFFFNKKSARTRLQQYFRGVLVSKRCSVPDTNDLFIYFSGLELHRGKTVGSSMPLIDRISLTRILLLRQQSHKKKNNEVSM